MTRTFILCCFFENIITLWFIDIFSFFLGFRHKFCISKTEDIMNTIEHYGSVKVKSTGTAIDQSHILRILFVVFTLVMDTFELDCGSELLHSGLEIGPPS